MKTEKRYNRLKGPIQIKKIEYLECELCGVQEIINLPLDLHLFGEQLGKFVKEHKKCEEDHKRAIQAQW